MPRKKVQTQRAKDIEMSMKRARRYNVHSELCDVKNVIAIIQEGMNSSAGIEWYLNQKIGKSKKLQEEIAQLDKELKEDTNERI